MAIFGLPGGAEWWIILGVVLLLFGPTQIPKLAKMVGKSAKSLKEGIDGKLDDDGDTTPSAKADMSAEDVEKKKDSSDKS